MNALQRKLAGLIPLNGPMSVAHYMTHCLFDPAHGYYTTREPFGADGDFTTAPEISQMFGELVAVWLYMAWEASGRKSGTRLVEIGPGRGTMMADILRTLARLPGTQPWPVALVEASPRLRSVQQAALAGRSVPIDWYERFDDVPEGPLLVVGNEIFDALPLRQFVKTADGWRERVVGLQEDGSFCFLAGAGTLDAALLPAGAEKRAPGTIFEAAPARAALIDSVAGRLARGGGCALFFDYGHLEPGFGDTFQAVRGHRPVNPLIDPGEADLTSHVDFAVLAQIARNHGLAVETGTQRSFLEAMGIDARAHALSRNAPPEIAARIQGELSRLTSDDEMGILFKVMCVFPQDVSLPSFLPH